MQSLLPVGITARKYQQSIADSAIRSNTLVVLPTGLGKTTVALLVAMQRLTHHPTSKAVILAPTRPLVLQHEKFFQQHYPNPTPTMTGLTGESSPAVRQSQFEESRLIFATPEVIRNDTISGRYDLGEVSLIVFDEAHRCVRSYAYSDVASTYKAQAKNPLILALTASPSARKTRIQEICDKLAITNVETRTESDEDVTPYVQDVSVNWERLQLPAAYRKVSQILRTAFDERIGKLRSMHQLPASVPVSKRLLLELGEKLHKTLRRGGTGAMFGAVLLQAQAMSLSHAIDLLETQGAKSAHRFLFKLDRASTRSARGLARDPRVVEATNLSSDFFTSRHPKQDRLRELLLADLRANPSAKAIVFTQFRDTVEAIVEDLKGLDKVSPVRFVGQATKSERDLGLTQDEQVKILTDFRDGDYNVLVTTSIGEEGLHVPDVDHVIFYEAVPSEIRMIQRRGRTGRTRPGKTTVLMTEGTIDEAYYWSSRRKEQQMRQHLKRIKEVGIHQIKKKNTLLDYA
ncbi:MAG TPA: DEAD/DEAH box helicase [Candidatus Bathyarchaeia archaeon]|nr:DEAD/DEAH box helicase [Candidatus Bathyarchaeia archaeon]